MLLVVKLNDFGHQTQCYWNLSSRVYKLIALPFTPLPLGEGLGVRLFVPSLPVTIGCPGLLTLYIKDMKFRLVNLDSLQTIRPYAHEGVVVFFRKLDVGQVGNAIIEVKRIPVPQFDNSHFAVIG